MVGPAHSMRLSLHAAADQEMPVVSAARVHPRSLRVSYSNRIMGLGPRPLGTTPDKFIGPAVSPSGEVVLRVRISVLEFKDTNEFFVLPKRPAIIAPTRAAVVRMLVPRRLPIAPDRSLRLTSVLFCDENIGALVGEDVFPSAPHTSRLVVRPHKLPPVVLSPRVVWPSRWSIYAKY